MCVFIAGSINIKHLDSKITERIDNILAQKIEVLVGDADGVDASVQHLFIHMVPIMPECFVVAKNQETISEIGLYSALIPTIPKAQEHTLPPKTSAWQKKLTLV